MSRRPSTTCSTISTFEQPPATTETKQAVSADLQETPHDIDIPQNAKVLQYVQLFSGRLKGYLEDGLSRGAQYLPMIQEVFRAEGLPLDLAYVPLIESAFKPSAVSRAKAKGIWQFMQRHRRSRTVWSTTGTSTSAPIRKRPRAPPRNT